MFEFLQSLRKVSFNGCLFTVVRPFDEEDGLYTAFKEVMQSMGNYLVIQHYTLKRRLRKPQTLRFFSLGEAHWWDVKFLDLNIFDRKELKK